jgi:hypothetical protein
METIDRRAFLRAGGTAAAWAALGGTALPAAKAAEPNPASAPGGKTVAIQIGAPSFVDEGVEACLDTLEQKACVNTLLAITYSYKDGLSGRPAKPVDHGSQRPPPKFHGGYYATPHAQFYRETLFKDDVKAFRAPDEGDFDLLASVIPAARRRGIKTIPFLADQIDETLPQFQQMAEWDLRGNKLAQVCFNNPHFRAFQLAMAEDCIRSYPLNGLLWRSERWGPLSNALSLSRGAGAVKDTQVSCFCPYCVEVGKKDGINVERVRAGYDVLEKFATDARADRRPPDGYFVTFWRILLDYPQILAWDAFWYRGLRGMYNAVYEKVKSIQPDLPVGSALPATISFNPFYRAAVELRDLAGCCDFLKVIDYHTDGGPRCAKYVDGMHSTFLRDVPRDQVLSFLYQIMGFDGGTYDEVRANGLPAEYVYREARTWMDGVKGTKLKLWIGIDVDVSPGESDPPRSRQGVRDAVLAAFRADVPGVVLSRMYSEMTLEHLAGAGDAIRQLGWAK